MKISLEGTVSPILSSLRKVNTIIFLAPQICSSVLKHFQRTILRFSFWILQTWRFVVYKHIDGSYHGYATLHYGNFKTVIAHFLPQLGEVWTEEHPITKWRLDKILIGDVDKGWFAYDCNVVRDENGTLYLIYNAGYPNETLGVDIHIKAWRLLDPATLDPNFTPRPILSPEGYRSETRLNGLGRYVWTRLFADAIRGLGKLTRRAAVKQRLRYSKVFGLLG